MSENMKQCYHLLNKTGRSFGATISFLQEELRDAICLFYLVVRAMDTVEDDMTLPQDIKKAMLRSFDKYLQDVSWKYSHSNDEHAVVLEQFPCIVQALAELPNKYQRIILELGIEISQGMAAFVGKEFITMEDMNEYCRHIGCIFCLGLTRLFVAAGLETEITNKELIVKSALLLHKINMIRDFGKDWKSGRLYLTKDSWSKYVDNPGDFLKPENFDKGVECVNELVTDALQYTTSFMSFLQTLRSPDAIKFFGTHKVMAAATLERCYDNPRVFTETVKIQRGESVEIMNSASCLTDIVNKVRHYINKIQERAQQTKESPQSTVQICQQILQEL